MRRVLARIAAALSRVIHNVYAVLVATGQSTDGGAKVAHEVAGDKIMRRTEPDGVVRRVDRSALELRTELQGIGVEDDDSVRTAVRKPADNRLTAGVVGYDVSRGQAVRQIDGKAVAIGAVAAIDAAR